MHECALASKYAHYIISAKEKYKLAVHAADH